MFHTMITLAYIIPNIYVFVRICQLFINKGYRLQYTLIYILIALIYPVSNFFPGNGSGLPARVLSYYSQLHSSVLPLLVSFSPGS